MSTTNGVTTYSSTTTRTKGTTGTGFDQLIDFIYNDPGLRGGVSAQDLANGVATANRFNQIILEAANSVGALADGRFTSTEVVAMNAYIRQKRLTEWTALHGDDEDGEETGFHTVQNDGSTLQHRGSNLINTVIDGIYHMGFEIKNGTFLNEDGNANATVDQVTAWLNQFYVDRSTTGSALDRLTDMIMADAGLGANRTDAQMAEGLNVANDFNKLILQAINATGALNDNWISTTDLKAMNAWIRADATRLAKWTELHGDDEGNGEETGFHLMVNNGSNSAAFGRNLVNTVADGIYHMGFQIKGSNFLNEDGNANVSLNDVSQWLNYFLSDASSTGTGLDIIVDTIKADAGLVAHTKATDINTGAKAANSLNLMIVDAIKATNAMADGWITSEDLVRMNAWLKSDDTRLETWTALHGDDENEEETGFHLVVNDGANTKYFGRNLVNTVADGIYHLAFEIKGDAFVNEDGTRNQTLADVAAWLNYFYKGSTLVNGTGNSDTLTGSATAEEFVAGNGNDVINAGAGNDLIAGGYGDDTINAGDGDDIIVGGSGNDTVDGGNGSDTYRVTGNVAGGWSSFHSHDLYKDTGTSGIDTIQALGDGDVDVGLLRFDASSGIEIIDATGATGTVRLLGDWQGNVLDFSKTTFKGTNIVIDGGDGNDTITGTEGSDTIIGGRGDDTLNMGAGSDTYRVTGNVAGGWSSFQGYDTYKDSGASGTDTIQAIGDGNVDIGLSNFDATSGIDVIDGTGATGTVRLLGGWQANAFDFSGVTFKGTNITIDAAEGNDTIIGSAGNDVITCGSGNDSLAGGAGNDTYLFGRGSGADTVNETAGNDLLSFGINISASQLWFRHVANNLEVSVIGTGDKVTITDWYSGSAKHIEQFKTSDGKVLLDTQVENLVSAMARFAVPSSGQTTLSSSYQTALAPVIAANWK